MVEIMSTLCDECLEKTEKKTIYRFVVCLGDSYDGVERNYDTRYIDLCAKHLRLALQKLLIMIPEHQPEEEVKLCLDLGMMDDSELLPYVHATFISHKHWPIYPNLTEAIVCKWYHDITQKAEIYKHNHRKR